MNRRRAAALGITLLAAGLAASASAERPEIDYMLHCQGCHRADGGASPTDAEVPEVPALRDFVGRFLAVPGGRAYLVQVPGSAQSALDDDALAALLNWIIRRFGPEEAARELRPYSAEEVAGYRSTPLTEVARIRADLLRRMQAASP